MAALAERIGIDPGEHIVQFYDDESDLALAVGQYLGDGVAAGAAALAIATEPHRHLFAAELEGQQIDVATHVRDGTLILLDAAATMTEFMRNGRVDRDAFQQVIGAIVRDAGAAARPVRAYGEMVALLWEAGNVVAAIELEECWNELSGELPFALLCGYRSESVQPDEQADALGQICRLHSSVVHPPGAAPDPRGPVEIEVSACFAPRPESAGPARDFVIDALRGWGHGGALLDDAQLVVSELATNAIVHARSVFWVEVRTQSSGLRLSVRDASPDVPTACQAVPLAPSGRGLDLVVALATSWGVDLTAGGKTVWAELGF